jgi:hypothetical protein
MNQERHPQLGLLKIFLTNLLVLICDLNHRRNGFYAQRFAYLLLTMKVEVNHFYKISRSEHKETKVSN